MKKQHTVWLLAAMVFTIAMFFSCAEGDVEVEHKDVLPEEEIREQIALDIFNLQAKADQPISHASQIDDPEEVEEVEQIENRITCRDVVRNVSMDFETVDLPILRNWFGSHSGPHKMNVSIGKNFDEWVSRTARLYIKDVKISFDTSISAPYVYLNQPDGAHFIWLFGISGNGIDEIGWDGEVDVIPLLRESSLNKPEEGRFWKSINIQYHAYGKLPDEDFVVEVEITVLACGDFTDLNHVFFWEG